ncbi:unnamed protein product [Hermetia illucens]|uniref:DUF6570 domain-containing protein n=1 Tax=Hermetia illucens TaxID=343691 RepID=A0A7R8UE88_HERIL|nr:unnamed protein product [Hermetia illucens]
MVDGSVESNPAVFEVDKSKGVKKIVKSHKIRNKIQVKENILKRKQILRSKGKVADKEKERNRILKRHIRLSGFRKQESVKDKIARRIARSEKSYQETERTRDRQAKRNIRRENPEVRASERIRDKNARRKARENVAVKKIERDRDAKARRSTRQIARVRIIERLCDTAARRNVREDAEVREKEKLRDNRARQKTREIKEIRELEKERDSKARCTVRTNEKYRRKEQLRDSLARQRIRMIQIYRTKEQIRDTAAHRKTRKNSLLRDKERTRDMNLRRIARRNLRYRKGERQRDTKARRAARSKSQYLQREISRQATRKQIRVEDWNAVYNSFAKNVREGYTNACYCCGRLWPIKLVRQISQESLIAKRKGNLTFSTEYIESIFSLHPDEASGLFCRTCIKSILVNEIPKLARVNGLIFPPIPQVLKELTPLEERLVSPRHIFLKIVRKGSGLGYQYALAGNVINVPVEVDTMVSVLPRSSSDHHVISVELKRKMCYQHGRKEIIRPEKVRQAASYLTNGKFFQDLGIRLNDAWSDDTMSENTSEPSQECTCNIRDQQEEELINPDGGETMLDSENNYTLVMAPGEGKIPLSLIYDENMEELGFIKIHCGEKRIFKVKLSHLDVIKSELSREDRRAVRADYLFTAKETTNQP